MSFMHAGLAVAGLLCVSIPIIIHLLMRRRRKPVMWGAMRFLIEAYKRQRRKLLIERWLLLATRCAILALIAFAIGRPLIGAMAGVGTGRTLHLLIDNGLASQVVGPDGRTALDRHLDAAREAVGALADMGGEQSSVGIITMGGPAETIVAPPSTDLAAVGALLDQIAPTDARTDLSGTMRLLAEATSTGDEDDSPTRDRVYALVLSEFLAGSADPSEPLPNLPERVELIVAQPAQQVMPNVSITAVEPLRSVVVTGDSGEDIGGEQVRVQLRRSGDNIDAAQTTTVRVRVVSPDGNGNERRATVNWDPGQEIASTSLQLGGRETGTAPDRAFDSAVIVAQTDDDVLGADNTWRRPVEIRQALRIGIAAPRTFSQRTRPDELGTGAWMRLALRPDISAGIEIIDVEPGALDQAQLARLDGLVIARPDLVSRDLWARVRLFLDRGGMVVVTPPPDATVHLWTDPMTEALDLPWTIAREVRDLPVDAPLSIDPESIGTDDTTDGLLGHIRGELDDLGLARAVQVFRVLDSQIVDGNEPTLALTDGTAFMRVARPTGPDAGTDGTRGLVVFLASALDLSWTDLPTKPLMVPLVQEIFRQGIGAARGTWQAVAGEPPVLPARTIELRASSWADGDVAADDQLIEADAAIGMRPIRNAGVWDALDDRRARRGIVAINADPGAGDVGTLPKESVGAWLAESVGGTPVSWIDEQASEGTGAGASVSAVLGAQDDRRSISLPLLIAALALAVLEVFLARWSSHATVTTSATRTGAATSGSASVLARGSA